MTTNVRIPRHVTTLDSMRAISALVVVMSHLVQIFWLPLIGLHNAIYPLNHILSETAVIVFFLLSGYLITMSIWKNIGKNAYFQVSDFAVTRVARIYPPLICAILVSLGVFYLIKLTGLPGVATPLKLPSDLYSARDYLTFVRGEVKNALLMRGGLLQINGPLWSLYIEVAIYAAAGAAALAWKGRAWVWRVAGGIACAAFFLFIVRQNYSFYAIWWLMGSAFFLCQLFARRDQALWLAAGVLGGAALYFSPQTLGIEGLRLCTMLVLSYLMFFVWTWEWKRLESVAGFSYTLYLIHFPIIILGYSIFLSLQGATPLSPASRAIAAMLAFAAAYMASWGLGLPLENTRFFKRLIFAGARLPFRRLKAG